MSLTISHLNRMFSSLSTSYHWRRAIGGIERIDLNIGSFFRAQMFVRRNCQVTSRLEADLPPKLLPLTSYIVPVSEELAIGNGAHSLKGGSSSAQPVIEKKDVGRNDVYKIDDFTSYGELHMTESSEKSIAKLDVSLGLEGGFGLFSGNAEYKELKDARSSSYVANLVLGLHVKTHTLSLKNEHKKLDTSLLENRDPKEFIRNYGDYYVSGINYGGNFFVFAKIESSSKEFREHLVAKVKAKFEDFLRTRGEVADNFSEFRSYGTVQLSCSEKRGPNPDQQQDDKPKSTPVLNFKTMQQRINDFIINVSKSPTELSVIISPIAGLSGFPPKHAEHFNLNYQRKLITRFKAKLLDIEDALNDIKHSNNLSKSFSSSNDGGKLEDLKKHLEDKHQDVLKDKIRLCEVSAGYELPELCALCTPYPRDAEKDLYNSLRLVEQKIKELKTVKGKESEQLGKMWRESEGILNSPETKPGSRVTDQFNGVWRRIGKSRVFEANWIKARGEHKGATFKGLLEVYIRKNPESEKYEISAYREGYSGEGTNGTYRDAKFVKGKYDSGANDGKYFVHYKEGKWTARIFPCHKEENDRNDT